MERIDFSLRKLKKENSPLYHQTMEWVRGMDQELDGEEGKSFSEWIERNLENSEPFDTYIMVDKDRQIVLGTSSIVPDDQCVGEQLQLAGIWIGGVNIKREYRSAGLGNVLVDYLEGHLQGIADQKGEIVIVNLFARNPIAIRMYEKRGFSKLDGLVVHHAGQENEVYSKTYRPK